MNKIPCIRNKCITYPVCKHKRVIACQILFVYFKNKIERIPIAKQLPKLYILKSEEKEGAYKEEYRITQSIFGVVHIRKMVSVKV